MVHAVHASRLRDVVLGTRTRTRTQSTRTRTRGFSTRTRSQGTCILRYVTYRFLPCTQFTCCFLLSSQ